MKIPGAGGGVTGVLASSGKETLIGNSIALNPSVDGAARNNHLSRCSGSWIAPSTEDRLTLQDLYALSGMKIKGTTVTGGARDNWDGADVSYNAADGTFSTPWEDIFSDPSAWDIQPGKLPTLKGTGGQGGTIPEWIGGKQTANLYIGSEAELKAFRDRVNGVGGHTQEHFENQTVYLTADITLDSDSDWIREEEYYLPQAAAGAGTAPRLKEGAMVTGWLHDPATGLWFWLDATGAKAVGWRESAGKRYYFNPENDRKRGSLRTDTWIDGWYVGRTELGTGRQRRMVKKGRGAIA